MKIRICLFVLLIFATKLSLSQKYFNFYCTNVPKSRYNTFSLSQHGAIGWISTGNYTSPADCIGCFDYTRDSKLRKGQLDSLVQKYRSFNLRAIYSNQHVPNSIYFQKDVHSKQNYIITTLYRIESNTPTPIIQIKIVLKERNGNNPEILSIEIFDKEKIKAFDKNLVMSTYRKEIGKEEKPPEIEKN